ncbi:MAG: YraN family protein [Ferruginibacter sp.]
MAKHITTGKKGEELAASYFKERGYEIMHKNWRHKHWEIDIIANRNNCLHIIEVKTRASTLFGHPEENISEKKIRYLMNAAEEFTYQYPEWKKLQFDVLSITQLQGKPVEYFLIEDVYL